MLARLDQPIAAIATAPGRGAVGIVRVSAKSVQPIIDAVCGRALKPREATYLPFRAADGSAIDQGLAIHFPAPHSYTGEDVLELQAHGGPVVLQLLLARCLEAGAQPGGDSAAPRLPGLRLAELLDRFDRLATAPQLGWEATPQSGARGGPNPTLVNNVETLANVPHILARGSDWFRRFGTEASPGTVVCTSGASVAKNRPSERSSAR